MSVMKPPFLVPPTELNLWDTGFEHEYNLWKGKADSNKSTTKEDYRQHIIDLNNEFDMEDVFNKMDAAVAAIDTLLAFKKRFPNYDLNMDLDQMYEATKDAIFKDFIKFGVQLVENYEVRQTEASDQEEKELVENDLAGDSTIKEEVTVEVKDEVITVETLNLSQVGESPANLHDPKEKRIHHKRNKRKKEKRKERLLKFHQKLVNVSGLPPSRIMQEMQTPRLSSAKDGLPRRKLEFEKSAIPKEPEPKEDINNHFGGAGAVVPMPGFSQPLGQGVGNNSTTEQFSSLLSSPQTIMSWPASSVWPEARPMMGLSGNLNQPGLFNGSYSGYLTPPSLSPIPQSRWSVGFPSYQPQPQPVQLNGSPAYCFHCLQFGKVYNISPV